MMLVHDIDLQIGSTALDFDVDHYDSLVCISTETGRDEIISWIGSSGSISFSDKNPPVTKTCSTIRKGWLCVLSRGHKLYVPVFNHNNTDIIDLENVNKIISNICLSLRLRKIPIFERVYDDLTDSGIYYLHKSSRDIIVDTDALFDTLFVLGHHYIRMCRFGMKMKYKHFKLRFYYFFVIFTFLMK